MLPELFQRTLARALSIVFHLFELAVSQNRGIRSTIHLIILRLGFTIASKVLSFHFLSVDVPQNPIRTNRCLPKAKVKSSDSNSETRVP